MKNIFLILIFTFIYTGSIFAQSQNKIVDANYCIFVDGKVFKQQDGAIALLEENIKLENGTIVYPNGSYKLKDETKLFLKEDECIGFSGKVYESQDKLNEALFKKYKKIRR